MTQAIECPEARVSLGVYVLGAIDPADRALVDAHLTTCNACRDELAGLAGLPALLSRVSAEEAFALASAEGPSSEAGTEGPAAPPELLASVIDLTAARRRRRRWRDAGLATALEENTSCCYAVQDKVWVDGPGGEPWEIYTVLADAEHPDGQLRSVEPSDAACCTSRPDLAATGVATAGGSCC